MIKSRSRKAILNSASGLLLEIVIAICSFILPRLILSYYGSAYNGIVSSVTQFIGCIALLKSGIGSVTRAALYKPLANLDSHEISEITNATAQFLRKIAVIFIVFIVIFAGLFTFVVSDEFDWLFSFTLIIIISLSTFAQYYFGLPYQMLLQADQRQYVVSFVSIISTIFNTAIASILIINGFSIHIVKLCSALVFIIPSLYYNFWVRKTYNIDTTVKPNYELISQRWDAFGHQVANFINSNSSVILITIFLGLKEVSVYVIYAMICNSIKKLIHTISNGATAAFGNIIAKNEIWLLNKRFKQYNFFISFVSVILLSITSILLISFIKLYTIGITDVNYERSILGYLLCLAILFWCLKIPYEQIVFAFGHFKQTKIGAYIETIISIATSILFLKFYGLNGVVLGTILALLYRLLRYYFYVRNNLIKNEYCLLFANFIYAASTFFLSHSICNYLIVIEINNYFSWIKYAILVSSITIFVGIVVSFAVYKKLLLDIITDFIMKKTNGLKVCKNNE